MTWTSGGIGRAAQAIAVAVMLISLSACGFAQQSPDGDRVNAGTEFKEAREQLARAGQRLASETRPVTDREALAARLKLSPERFSVIKTGAQVSGPMTVAFDSSTNCKFGHCTCVGDAECNDMFSTICASPSTDGSCEVAGSDTICTCKYVAD